MSHAECFPPIETRNARLLILGSMPGIKSLQQQEYYAHPQNAFWKIMAGLLGFSHEISYAERLNQLLENQIALWDVMQTCHRPGSLDSAIEETSIIPNDFASFFNTHPDVAHLFFNGSKAEHAFKKHVLPELPEEYQRITMQRLPSTSPANARMNLEQKRADWEIVREILRT